MKIMNKREGKKIAVMAAVIMGFMVIAFMPMASAGVISFTVTPSTGIAGAVQSYDAYVITDGVTSINITIPAGFTAETPTTGGVEIARLDFYNSSTKMDYYGYGTITSNNANPTTQVDIYCKFGGDVITTPQPVNYTAGATNPFESGFHDGSLAIIKLPTETVDGYINLTINSTAFLLDMVAASIKQFVRNPLTADDYVFSADGMDATVRITAAEESDIALFRDGEWIVDTDGDHEENFRFSYGDAGDVPVVGDITQEGEDDTALFRDGEWIVDTDGDHEENFRFPYGDAGDVPVVGDITQEGEDDTVLFRDGLWIVDTSGDHEENFRFTYGDPEDVPVVGDITQEGEDDTVLFRDGLWIVDTDGDHEENFRFTYGDPGDVPVVGDIDQDGEDDTALFRDGLWIVDTDGDHEEDFRFTYGDPEDVPVVGDIG